MIHLPIREQHFAMACSFHCLPDAKHIIANNLNAAMFALANENSELWTRLYPISHCSHMA